MASHSVADHFRSHSVAMAVSLPPGAGNDADPTETFKFIMTALWARRDDCPDCWQHTVDCLSLCPDNLANLMAMIVNDNRTVLAGIDPALLVAFDTDLAEAADRLQAVPIEQRREWITTALNYFDECQQSPTPVDRERDEGLVWSRGTPPRVPRPRQRERTGARWRR